MKTLFTLSWGTLSSFILFVNRNINEYLAIAIALGTLIFLIFQIRNKILEIRSRKLDIKERMEKLKRNEPKT